MKIYSNVINEVLKLSKGENISFIGDGEKTYIIANDLRGKGQIVKKVYNGACAKTLIKREVLKLIPENCDVEITDNTIVAKNRKIKYAPNTLVDNKISVANFLTRIEGKELNHLLSGFYAISTSPTRPVLEGMCINNGEFVACDGFRLSIRKGNFQCDESVIMDLNMVNMLKKIKYDKEIEVYYNDRYVKFVFGDLEIIGNRIEGEYLNYKSFIPEECNTSFTLETGKILKIIKDYKKNKFTLVKLDLKFDKLLISSSNKTASIEDEVGIKLQGDELKLAFNVSYLIDALKNYEVAKLDFINNVSPVIITDSNKLDLVLQVRIRD